MTVSRRLDCDVAVIGGGVAGMSAAICAARAGAESVLVERNDFPGGTAVTGMHQAICGLYENVPRIPAQTLNDGIVREICSHLKNLSPDKSITRVGRVYVLPFRVRDLVAVLRGMSEAETRLTVLYGRQAIAVEKEDDGRIASLVVDEGRKRILNITARAFIDCSGNAVIAGLSGAPVEIALPHRRQFAGFSIKVKGLVPANDDAMLPWRVPYHLARAVAAGTLDPHLRFTTFALGDQAEEGYLKLSIPPAGAEDERDEKARRDALRVHDLLRTVLPEFRHSTVEEVSSRVVERDGPRIRGEYTLGVEDILHGRKFSDGAVKNAWPVELWDQEKGPIYRYIESGDYYEIPLRCLCVKGFPNLLFAGRCISVSREALGSTRVMGPCFSLGQSAALEAVRRMGWNVYETDRKGANGGGLVMEQDVV